MVQPSEGGPYIPQSWDRCGRTGLPWIWLLATLYLGRETGLPVL